MQDLDRNTAMIVAARGLRKAPAQKVERGTDAPVFAPGEWSARGSLAIPAIPLTMRSGVVSPGIEGWVRGPASCVRCSVGSVSA
jgi:hypothetical protein